MHIYLICHAETTEPNQVTDPYSAELTLQGLERARALAEQCERWGVQLLAVSNMLRAQQTADAIHQKLPNAIRWDSDDLEDVNLDDLFPDPIATHHVSTWTPEQFQRGLESAWNRAMSLWTRLMIFGDANALESAALVANARIIRLMLLNAIGHDWQDYDKLVFGMTVGSTTHLELLPSGQITVDWINRR